jgi:ubiquinone/menaquinone biosynthesis C-methylase UbiE
MTSEDGETREYASPAYSASSAYADYRQAVEYERIRFGGYLGRYRYRREQRAVRQLVEALPRDISVLDCPCGTGRWWDVLSRRASRIIAVDISDGMLRYARERARDHALEIEVTKAAAEALPLPDESVDVSFSHALTKHLPVPVQYQVLRELARVASTSVICSFGVFSHITYELWRRRRLRESYPILREELGWMADFAGLEISQMRKCTTPFGVEHSVLFMKKPRAAGRPEETT